MSHINQNQIDKLNKFLDQQGLTFKPLREEMLDHLQMDIASQIELGNSFEEAFSIISNDIPENHFKLIQNETMEAINKRYNVARIFSILSILLLAVTSVFKLLHLPGTGIMLISSMASIALSMVIGALSGVMLYKEKQGRALLFLTIMGILYFFYAYVTQILNFSEAAIYKTSSVAILLVLFPALTIYYNKNLTSENHILIYLHKKHTPGIDRFLLILLAIAFILRLSSILFQYPPNVSQILLFIVACSAGLQFFALNWHPEETDQKGNYWITIALVISFAFFIVPTLGSVLNLPTRVAFSTSFYILAGIIALSKGSNEKWHFILIGIISLIFITWSLGRLEIIDQGFYRFIFNIPVMLVLLAGLYFSKKHSVLRTYIIIVIAHYLYEFPELI